MYGLHKTRDGCPKTELYLLIGLAQSKMHNLARVALHIIQDTTSRVAPRQCGGMRSDQAFIDLSV
ncbi:hypothetical protein IF2G_02296 [Cordyceps javanica]|nr:hypothetical protein IF2G_02296 [Cordyceps javanica]